MSEMQTNQVRNDLPDVISIDAIPDAPTAQQAPDVIDINSFPDAISIDSLPDGAPAQAPASGMMEGLGAAAVRGYQNASVEAELAEKVRLQGYKNSLEQGGPIVETEEEQAVRRMNQSLSKMPMDEQGIRAAEIARVTANLAKLDQSIKDREATRSSYTAQSAPYQALQAGIEQARKSTTPVRDFVGTAWDNIAGLPELMAEGAYSTARPIAGAFATAIAARKGGASNVAQRLAPIAASMGITGVDSYKSAIAETIEKKAKEGGIDLRKNPEMMGPLLTDANFIEAMKTDALKSGLNDAAWAGISTWLGMTPKIKGVWQPIVQGAAEGGTEMSNKVVRGKKIDSVDTGIAVLTGLGFEGPGYALGRAAGAFGSNPPPATPTAPGPQAQTTPTPGPQAQPQAQAATPDTIDINSLPPSVAGEVVAPVEQPSPAAEQPAPAPVPQVQPAPVAQPQPVVPPAPVAATPASQAEATPSPPAAGNVPPAPSQPVNGTDAENQAYLASIQDWTKKYGQTHNLDGTPRPQSLRQASRGQPAPAPAPQVQPAPAVEAPAPVQQEAPAPVAEQPVTPVAEPAPVETPAPVAEAVQPPAVQAEAPVEQPKVEPVAKKPRSEMTEKDFVDQLDADLKAGKIDEDTYWNSRRQFSVTPDDTKPLSVETPKAEAKPVEPAPAVRPTQPAQTEIAGTEDTFNLAGEQVAPQEAAKDTTEELALENPLLSEARVQLERLKKAGKGDSDQAARLRRTIADYEQPAAPAQAEAPVAKTEPVAKPAQQEPAPAPVAEQPKPVQPAAQPEAPAAKPQPKPAAEPSLNDAAKAKKTDQPQTKRARTALANAIRTYGRDDLRTRKKYRAVLDALEREKGREARAKDITQPYLGRKEPADITAARALLAKKAKATGGIDGFDVAKANALIEQYEAEVDLSMGQLRDEGQIKLVSDETLDRVIAHVEGMKDAGLKPDEAALNALQLAQDERVRRENETGEDYGDPIADVRSIVRNSDGKRAIPLLPESIFGSTEYSGLKENLPPELALKGGVFAEPFGGIDMERARKDADYRNQIRTEAEGMLGRLVESLQGKGWTQLDGGFDVIPLLQDASMGKPMAPAGGVEGASFKGDPSKVSKTHGGDINLDMLSSEGKVNADEQADTREPEPSDEEKQNALQMEVEYEEPRYDAEPTPADQAVLDAAADQPITEQSILEALDKAAAERLDPRNRNSLGPDLIAAMAWQTARDIQKGLVNFAGWAAKTAKNFPSLKGSLKAIWAKAQQIAKNPMDYIRFRALDSIADKVWQNAGRNKASATLRKIANIVFAKSGPDADAVENDIPTRVGLVRAQFSNIYANIMERFAAEFSGMTKEQRRQWDVDFRDAVLGRTTPTDPKMVKAVAEYRALMRDMLAYQRNAGITMGDQGANYFPRAYDPDAVTADRDGFLAVAEEMYRKREARLLEAAQKKIEDSIDARAAERKAADKKFGRQIKSDAEYRADAIEWANEKIAELQAEYDAKGDDWYKGKAEDWATAITHGDVLGLTLFKSTEGKVTSDATDARTFNDSEAALADEFLKKNVDDITMGYVDGAVRGAEIARVFGEDGKKFEQMMNQLSREGVDKDTIKETRELVAKALGVGREQLSQAEAVFFDWVNVALAGAFLGKTFIYNLVLEPISFGVRTGNAYLALKGVAETWKAAIAEIASPSPATRQRLQQQFGSRANFETAVNEAVAEQLGLIQKEIERTYLNTHWDYSSDNKGSKVAKWISQRIYRANLMSATEKAKVQASIAIARLALRDNARFLTGDAPLQKVFKKLGMDVSADKSVATILTENGIPEADHKAFAAWVAGLEGKTDAEWQAAVMDPKDPMAKHYRRALQRMSIGLSIKTNPALKMASSDSVLGRMLMQLMNYSYAYSNLVKDRMYSMAAATVSKDASTIDRLRYAAPLLVGAPLAVLGAAASKELIAALWPSDEYEEMDKKRSAARKAFDYSSFAGLFGPKIEYLVKGFERKQVPGGPTAEMIFRGGAAAFSSASDPENEKKVYNLKKQAFSGVLKPAATGGAAAAHPFFGFLTNAAVNRQETREAVIGERPRR